MNESKAKLMRLKSFEERKDYDREGVYKVPQFGWEYINVHPMADETEVLRKLCLQPDDCKAVDCYWHVGSDVVFLQVYSRMYLQDREPALYAHRWPAHDARGLTLLAYLNEPYISRETVERVMQRFYVLDLDGPRFSRQGLPGGSILISEV
jgi:hypothetical protein